jgi:hypothetical protein
VFSVFVWYTASSHYSDSTINISLFLQHKGLNWTGMTKFAPCVP